MSRWLHLALEYIARNDDSEMGFGGRRASHGVVVRVLVGVIVDLEFLGESADVI